MNTLKILEQKAAQGVENAEYNLLRYYMQNSSLEELREKTKVNSTNEILK